MRFDSEAAAREALTARESTELLVEALSDGAVDLDRLTFYSRLAEGVSRIGHLRRVVIFRFDDATRRVEAAGAHGISLSEFASLQVGLEAAPDAARALAEDRVVEVRPPHVHAIPAEFEELVGEHPLVYVPMAAAGRWPGVIIGEPEPGSAPLDEARRELLWTVGKTLALASIARTATFYGELTRELKERLDLARELHERVVQRLFGVAMALSPPGPLEDEARARCGEELAEALEDLRAALSKPLRAAPRPTQTTLAAELSRLQRHGGEVSVHVEGPLPEVPAELEPLAQSVLAEALRNARKHADARSVTVRVRRAEGLLTLEVENDGVGALRRRGPPGIGLRITALEAMQAGGLLDFGERSPGCWQVRMIVPTRSG